MKQKSDKISLHKLIIVVVVISNTVVVKAAFVGKTGLYWWLLLSMPLLIIAIYDARQTKKQKRIYSQGHPAIWK